MLAVNMMRTCEAAPEPLKQETAADDDGGADATAAVKVLDLVRATPHTPSQETDPCPMPGTTPSERRKTALRAGYAACLLPG